MKIWKIIIGLSILLLLIGIVSAADIDTLKTPGDYKDLKDGCAADKTYPDRMLYVEKAGDDYKEDWFTNTSDMIVSNVGDNIYLYSDTVMETYGYQEIVNIDGTDYLVSINQGSKLSPSEETTLLNVMKDFNQLNNLEPVEI